MSNKYNLFPTVETIPNIASVTVNESGGNLTTGVYFIALAYEQRVLTNFSQISKPIYIHQGDINTIGFAGTEGGLNSSKSITIELSNLDTDYRNLKIAVIHFSNGVLEPVKYLPLIRIPNSGNIEYTITGSESSTFGALEEVVIDNAYYETAKTLKFTDGALYLANLTEPVDIGYQKFANNIKVRGVSKTEQITDTFTTDEGIDKTITAYFERGSNHETFRRGEVHAFYISLLLKNGGETRAYHIPGRPGIGASGQFEFELVPNGPIPAQSAGTNAKGETSPILIDDSMLDAGNPEAFGISVTFLSSNVFVPLQTNDSATQITTAIIDALNGDSNFNNDFEAVNITADQFRIRTLEDTADFNDVTFTFTVQDISAPGLIDPEVATITGGSSVWSGDFTAAISQIGLSTFTVLTEAQMADGLTVAEIIDAMVTAYNAQSTFSNRFTAVNDNDTRVLITSNTTSDTFTFVSNIVPEIVINQQVLSMPTGVEQENVSISELQDISPNAKNYQLLSEPDTEYNMAFWENAQEFYPSEADDTNGDFEIHDASGMIGTLHSQNVRHHKIPNTDANQLNASEFSQRLIGVKFEDIYIPPEIADKVIGYKIYSAEKTDNNKLVIGSGLMYQYLESTQDDILRLEPKFPGDSQRADGRLGFIGFDTVSKRRSIVGADYVLLHDNTKNTDLIEPQRGERRAYYSKNVITNKEGRTHYKLDLKGYVDHGSIVNIPGETLPVENDRQMSHIFLKNNDFPLFPYEVFSGSGTGYSGTLCSWKQNVHLSFNSQNLVNIETNVISGTGIYETDELYNGGAFVNNYHIKTWSQTFYGIQGRMIVGEMAGVTLESWYNVKARQEGPEVWMRFFPASNLNDTLRPDVNLDENIDAPDDRRLWDDYLEYNEDYNRQNNLKQPGIYDLFEELETDLPNTIIRSNNITNKDEFRTFLVDNRLDMDKSRGEIIKLDKVQNIVLIHCLRGLFRTQGKQQMETTEDNVFVGSGDILAFQPDEFVSTPLGFGGITNPYHSINTPYGYYFIDAKDTRVFHLLESLNELSGRNYGMHNFFKGVRNPRCIGFDPINNRIICSFQDNTISFSTETQKWISFHDYQPNFIFNTLTGWYSFINNKLWKHDLNKAGHFYNADHDLVIEFISNENPLAYKRAVSLIFIGDSLSNYEPSSTLEGSVEISNSYQKSGKVEFTPFPSGNLRRTSRNWIVNRFRTAANDWWNKNRFTDKWHKVKLTLKNDSDNYIYLTILELINKVKPR